MNRSRYARHFCSILFRSHLRPIEDSLICPLTTNQRGETRMKLVAIVDQSDIPILKSGLHFFRAREQAESINSRLHSSPDLLTMLVIRQLDQTKLNKDISHNFRERAQVFESIFRVIRINFSHLYSSFLFPTE